MIKNKAVLRTVASLLTAFFLTTNTVAAQSVPFVLSVPSIARLADLRIPDSLGTLGDRHQGDPSKPFLIFIQDAHTSREAQYRIRDLLGHLDKQYGIRALFLEGATRRLDPSLYHLYKEGDKSREAGAFLLEQGELTGAELFLLEREIAGRKDIAADGIESIETYAANLLQFRAVAKESAAVRRFMAEVRQSLRARADRIFFPELRSFFSLYEDHLENRISLQAFLDAVKVKAQEHLSLDLGNAKNQFEYPMLVRYSMIKALQSSVDPAASDADEKKLRGWLESHGLDAAVLDRISGKSKRSLGIRQELEALSRAASPKGFDFKDYPAWSAQAAFRGFQEELESGLLAGEMDRLTQSLFTVLARGAEEKSLLATAQDAILLDKLLNLSLSGTEWEKIVNKEGGFGLAAIAKAAGTESAGEPLIQNTFDLALDFYRTARKREAPFLQNIAEHFRQGGARAGVVITGGFHAEGLKSKLREAGFSYAEVTPRITALEKRDERLYVNALLETAQIQQFLRMVPVRDMTTQERELINPGHRRGMIDLAMKTVPGTLRGGRTALNDYAAPARSELRSNPYSSTPQPASGEIRRAEVRQEAAAQQATEADIYGYEVIDAGLMEPAFADLKQNYPRAHQALMDAITSQEFGTLYYWAGAMPRAAAVVRQIYDGKAYSFFAMDDRIKEAVATPGKKTGAGNATFQSLVYLLLLREALQLDVKEGTGSTLTADPVTAYVAAAEQYKVYSNLPSRKQEEIRKLVTRLQERDIKVPLVMDEKMLELLEAAIQNAGVEAGNEASLIETWGRLGRTDKTRELIDKLASPDEKVRLTAANALEALNTPESLFYAALARADRNRALAVPGAKEIAEKAKTHPNEAIRKLAAEVFQKIVSNEAREALIRGDFKGAAPEEAEAKLIAALGDRSEKFRNAALKHLKALGTDRGKFYYSLYRGDLKKAAAVAGAETFAEEAKDHANKKIAERAAVVWIGLRSRSGKNVDEFLKDNRKPVRLAAVKGLESLSDATSAGQLAEALSDLLSEVRYAAVAGLAARKVKTAVPAVIKRLDALFAEHGDNLGASYNARFRYWSGGVNESVLKEYRVLAGLLGDLGAAAGLDYLEKILSRKATYPQLQQVSLEQIRKEGGERSMRAGQQQLGKGLSREAAKMLVSGGDAKSKFLGYLALRDIKKAAAVPGAQEYLKEALAHNSHVIRHQAVKLAGLLKAVKFEGDLIEKLGGKSPVSMQASAAQALKDLGTRRGAFYYSLYRGDLKKAAVVVGAETFAEEARAHANEKISERAAVVLAGLRSLPGKNSEEFLKDTREAVRLAAVKGLAMLSDAASAEHLVKALGDGSQEIRLAAAAGLAARKVETAVPAVIKQLDALFATNGVTLGATYSSVWKKWQGTNENALKEYRALAELLGTLGRAAGLDYLEKLLERGANYSPIRVTALEQIQKAGGSRLTRVGQKELGRGMRTVAAEMLVSGGDAKSRFLGALALRDIKKAAAIPGAQEYLTEALAYPSGVVSLQAVKLIGRLKAVKFESDLVGKLGGKTSKAMQASAAQALKDLGTPRGLFYYSLYQGDLKKAAAVKGAEAFAEEAMALVNKKIAERAAVVLAGLRSRSGQDVEAFLKDPRVPVRLETVKGLVTLSDAASAKQLAQAINDESLEVRLAVVAGLAARKAGTAVPFVIKRLEALFRTKGPSLGATYDSYWKWKGVNEDALKEYRALAELLGTLGTTEGLDYLEKILKQAKMPQFVRKAASVQLQKHGRIAVPEKAASARSEVRGSAAAAGSLQAHEVMATGKRSTKHGSRRR